MGTGDGELDPLILADGAVKDDAFVGIVGSAVDIPIDVPNTLGGKEDPFGVNAVEHIAKALALLANQIFRRDQQVIKEKLGGVMVHHHLDWLNREAVADRHP